MKFRLPEFPRKQPQEWMVVEFNGFRCTAAHMTVSEGKVQIVAEASASKATVDQSFSSALKQIHSEDRQSPKQAILVTSQAAAAIIALPINPAVPSKREQLQALVQWEFEQVLSEHASALTLETILAGKACMTEDEIDEVRLAIGEQKATSSCISIAPKKFGAQAVKLGYITPEELDTSLELLEAFSHPDDSPLCNFFPIDTDGIPASKEGFPWLVSGIGSSNQSNWIQRFASHGIRLERIYPLGFAGAAALIDHSENETIGMISLLEGSDCYTSYRNDQLQSLRWGPAPLSPRNPEALCSLISEDPITELWLSGRQTIVEGVTPIINQATKFPTCPYPNHFPEEIALTPQSSEERVQIIGAIRHQTGSSTTQIPWIEGAAPPPPWWHQSSKWWGIMGITLSCLVGISELALGLKRHSITLATKEVHQQMESARGEIAKVEHEASTADQLLEQQTELRQTIQVTTQAANLIEQGLELRQQYVSQLFMELAAAVTPAIAIDAFHETPDHSVTIRAWALSETDAQEFIHTLTTKLEPWGLSLAHQEVQSDIGRLGLTGYSLVLRLAPNPFAFSQKG